MSLDMKLSVDPDGKGYEEAFTFRVDAKIKASLDIDKDFTIKMKISALDIKVVEIISTNIGPIEIKNVNKVMTLLLNILKTLVNTLLSNGIDLGMFFENIPVVLKNIVISPRKGYYMIQANPYFDVKKIQNVLKQGNTLTR